MLWCLAVKGFVSVNPAIDLVIFRGFSVTSQNFIHTQSVNLLDAFSILFPKRACYSDQENGSPGCCAH